MAMDLSEARSVFALFLKENPISSIDEVESGGQKFLGIKTPWGEESFVLAIEEDVRELAVALEHVLLPERFTAVYHRDTKDMEFIWTARKLSQKWEEVSDRSFSYLRGDRTYTCEFARSSDRVLRIAQCFRPILSDTGARYRNLISFLEWSILDPDHPHRSTPRSFWIRNVEWDENEILDLVNHLNFYMTYYDHVSPTVVVHDPKRAEAAEMRSRYIHGPFPRRIESKPLDDVLLLTWQAAQNGDAARRYLYAYRVLEFASFSYTEIAVRNEVRRLLSAPNALDNIRTIADSVTSAMQKTKLDEVGRFSAVIADVVSPHLIWLEMNRNMAAFVNETTFDGGYVLPAFMAKGCREVDFNMKHFSDTLRAIRNALAHGRDQKSGLVIAPTTRNFELLHPWAGVAIVAAGEMVLYRDVL